MISTSYHTDCFYQRMLNLGEAAMAKATKGYEGSKADKAADRKSGAKEGSKADRREDAGKAKIKRPGKYSR